MKRMFTIFALFLILGAVPFAVALADELGYISVSEHTVKEVLPNKATIKISIETSAMTAQKASDENKAITQKVHSALKKLISDKDSIKTGEYSLYPQYSYTKDNKHVLDKYVVRNSVILTVFNVKNVSNLIDTAISNGATNVDDLQFSATDYDSACSEALVQVTKRAKEKANLISKSLNMSVVGVKSLTTSCNTEYGQRPYFAMAKGLADSVSASTPIESGKIKIDANVDALFYIK